MKEEKEENNLTNWYQSIIETTKQKSYEAFSIINEDLTELKRTMQHDSGEFISEKAKELETEIRPSPIDKTSENEKMEKNDEEETNQLSNIFNSFNFYSSKAMELAADALEKTAQVATDFAQSAFEIDPNLPSNSTTTTLIHPNGDAVGRFEMELIELQSDRETFTKELTENEEDQLNNFNLDDETVKEKIDEIMKNNESPITKLFHQLVPKEVDYENFWKRYFYRLQSVEKREENRKNLLNRFQEKETENKLNEDEVEKQSWDDDWKATGEKDDSTNVERKSNSSESIDKVSLTSSEIQKTEYLESIDSNISKEGEEKMTEEKNEEINEDDWEKWE
ncbi:hypothetical protein SNEBB_010601 [Seison nebaliae]|nr:hypothetical protein SNEBB_010601 [Seison nebaliae]